MPGQDDDRRQFLKACGKFAAVAPPAITLLPAGEMAAARAAPRQGR